MKIIKSDTEVSERKSTDWEIIKSINTEDSIVSKQAFKEFYNRYGSFVLKICKQCCKNFDSSDLLADDIFQNTFLKVFHKAYTFKLKNSLPQSDISKEIKSWLSQIARNELINFLRKNPDEKALSNKFRVKSDELNYLPEIDPDIQGQEVKASLNKQSLDLALNTLTDREKYIVLTYMQFFDPIQPLRHIPEETLSEICNKYNLTPENVRQIKSRSIKKIKDFIEQLTTNNDEKRN